MNNEKTDDDDNNHFFPENVNWLIDNIESCTENRDGEEYKLYDLDRGIFYYYINILFIREKIK